MCSVYIENWTIWVNSWLFGGVGGHVGRHIGFYLIGGSRWKKSVGLTTQTGCHLHNQKACPLFLSPSLSLPPLLTFPCLPNLPFLHPFPALSPPALDAPFPGRVRQTTVKFSRGWDNRKNGKRNGKGTGVLRGPFGDAPFLWAVNFLFAGPVWHAVMMQRFF